VLIQVKKKIAGGGRTGGLTTRRTPMERWARLDEKVLGTVSIWSREVWGRTTVTRGGFTRKTDNQYGRENRLSGKSAGRNSGKEKLTVGTEKREKKRIMGSLVGQKHKRVRKGSNVTKTGGGGSQKLKGGYKHVAEGGRREEKSGKDVTDLIREERDRPKASVPLFGKKGKKDAEQ